MSAGSMIVIDVPVFESEDAAVSPRVDVDRKEGFLVDYAKMPRGLGQC